MNVEALLELLRRDPAAVEFEQVMAAIDSGYAYRAGEFSNGLGDDCVVNAAGSNEGSCKIFAFAQLHGLDAAQTLACFGRYYREDVLCHPEGIDHANIRTFMRHGPAGIRFPQPVLQPRD